MSVKPIKDGSMTSWAQGAFPCNTTALHPTFGDSGLGSLQTTTLQRRTLLGMTPPWPEAGQSRIPDMDAMPCDPLPALNTNSNVPLRSLPRVHKSCRQLFCSPPSILPPPPPLSTSLPNYSPWMLVIAPTTTATIFTPPSTFPIPTPPSPRPIQITPFPPTIPQTFSTLPHRSISTHLMFRVQFLPFSPQNNTPRLNSHRNWTPLTPTSLTTPFNWTRLQPPALPISARRVHTSL